MKYALLVALREFAENAKTKGFWIGLLVFPALIGLSVVVSAFLAGSTPSRHFVLIDQSNELAGAVERAVERDHQAAVLGAVTQYAREHLRAENREGPSLSAIPAPAGGAANRAAQAEQFAAAGGAAAFLERIEPRLRDDAPEFAPPPAEFVRIDPPAGLDTSASLDEIARTLRPYLAGDRLVSAPDGREVRLFAAILIAPDALAAVARPGNSPGSDAAARAEAIARAEGIARAGASARADSEVSGDAAASPVQYWSSNLTDNELAELVGRSLNDEVRRREYSTLGIAPEIVSRADRTSLPMGSYDPTKQEGEATVSVADRIVQNAPVAFVYLLWISIFVVMQMLLGNTIEEKSNRIIEVLLSSVTPSELMMGKLIGIAGIGMAMVGTWLVTAFVGIRLYRGEGAEVIAQALEALSSSGLVVAFVVYFVFGYLLYAGIFLSIGSLCRSLKDAQNLQGPVMIVMMVPLLTMVFINRDPHGPLATLMTWIPIYTPFVMMNRAAADPPLVDLIGATLLMIVTAVLVLWLSGRIFRIGILRVGQRAKFRDLIRWVRGADA